MKKQYAILGHPLGHTMSPPIHKRLFELSGNQDAEYLIRDISPDEFDERIPELLGMAGFNITIPYKTRIIKHLDRLDDSAKRYGSVNVVKCGTEKVGYNTDVDGFIRSIKALGTDLSGRVLLIGCGGVGRMMAVETALAGGELMISEREEALENAQLVVNDIKEMTGTSVNLVTGDNIFGEFDLIINSSPCGMHPNTDDIPAAEEIFKHTKYMFDAIYNPARTKAMSIAQANGAEVMSGMNMLVWQAAVAHEIWENASYSVAAVQAITDEMQKRV